MRRHNLQLPRDITLKYRNVDGVHYRGGELDGICKLDDVDVATDLKKADIVCLVETHCGANEIPRLSGFSPPIFNVRPKTPRAPYHSGGILIYIKPGIRKGVKAMPETNSEYRWLKLERNFFKTAHDIYILVAYISNGTFADKNDDVFELIENDVASFSKDGSEFFVCGDFNARTNVDPDYCIYDQNDNISEHIDLPYNMCMDTPIARNNSDTHGTDMRGKKLLNLCRSTGLRIVNGRVLGDTSGNLTCYSHSGKPSTIDYVLVSSNLLRSIKYLHVDDLDIHSIHCQLTTNLNLGQFTYDKSPVISTSAIPLKTSRWRAGDEIKFQSALASDHIQKELSNVIESLNTVESLPNYEISCDEAALKMVDIITSAANLANISKKCPSKSRCHRTKMKLPKSKPWFNEDCRLLKKQCNALAKAMKIDPFNREHSFQMLRLKKLYKATVRKNKVAFQQNIWSNLEKFKNSNPKEFWKLLDDLKGLDKKYEENPISMDQWVKHFTLLFNNAVKPTASLSEKINMYIVENRNKIFNELNFRIELHEVIQCIGSLKNKKAAGIDGIVNEMLKAGITSLAFPLQKLFNHILCQGHFPKHWQTNTLTPLHKKGDQLNPKNYRGIAVSNSIAKLFLAVLHRRLKKFTSDHGLVPNCQIAYKEKCSTADHILCLKNIIDKYISRVYRTHLYVCFVDFRSAFDTVWRQALLYKLLKMDIGGNFLNIIANMYQNVFYCVKLNGFISENINSNVGVKQGCVLSPLLFNLYLADLPDIFTDDCHPVNLANSKINCLMFADDLILLSESAVGLQRCIDKLQEYCSKWCLSVNMDKTKVIIFNKGGSRITKFRFRFMDNDIEIVNNYCYLGIIFSASGSFTKACDALYDKAMKAFYKFKQLSPQNNVQLALRLFDALVVPILTYAGTVWGPLYAHRISKENFFTLCNDSPIEKLNVKLSKYVLGVHKKSTNIAVRGELGRYPLLISVLEHSVRYFDKISSDTRNSLVKLSCTDSELCTNNKSWTVVVNKLCTLFDKSMMKASMQQLYREKWENLIYSFSTDSDNKLRTYAKFKKSFKMENYVLQFPLKVRRNLTKLRISAHNLSIETGRYTQPKKTPIEKRTCFHCKDYIDDESHFILNCKLYDDERCKLVKTLESFSTLNINTANEPLNLILSCLNGDLEVGRAICNFINICFSIRSQALSTKIERDIYLRPQITITSSGRHSLRPTKLDL